MQIVRLPPGNMRYQTMHIIRNTSALNNLDHRLGIGDMSDVRNIVE